MSLPRLGRALGMVLALTMLTACQQAQPGPTTAPAKPTEAPKAAAPAAKPAESPAAAAAPKPAESPAAAAAKPATSPAAAPAAAKPVASPLAAGQMPWELAGAGLITGPFEGEAKTLNGAGATFPAALYSQWFDAYSKLTGVNINYQSIGSGGGIKSISDQTVDFGATDGPMSDEQLKAAKGGEILHIPTALGAVVVTYNLPELGANQSLKLSSDTVAGIFLGEIARWDDAKIKADNPGLNLPSKDIITVHRSDGSGTTYIFVDYLSTISPKWKSSVGVGTTVNWPTGLGGKGNEGVAGEVKQNPYSVGYVELIYALQNRLGVAHVKNQAGNFVEPRVETVTTAAAGVSDTIAADLRASIVDARGDQAYPISGFTWILAYKEMQDRPKAIALTRMLWWATHDAQKFNGELGYAPLPSGIVTKAEEKIKSITAGGQPAFPNR